MAGHGIKHTNTVDNLPVSSKRLATLSAKKKALTELCQGTYKTRSVLDIQLPAELWQIYEGPLKGNVSLLNAWVEML